MMGKVTRANIDPSTGTVIGVTTGDADYMNTMPNTVAIPEGMDVTDIAALRINGSGELEQFQRLATHEEINLERDRRIDAGFVFAGHTFQCREQDREKISGASISATAAMFLMDAPSDKSDWQFEGTDFVWWSMDNTPVPLTPAQMIALGNAAMAHVSTHIHKARVLKDQGVAVNELNDDETWE